MVTDIDCQFKFKKGELIADLCNMPGTCNQYFVCKHWEGNEQKHNSSK